MKKEWRDWARDVLAHYGQDFDSRLVFENDDFFIMDWKDRNGSGNLATRYIVDKGRGDLIITGDAGDCIASWHNSVTPEDIACYINSVGYFVEKMQCTTNKHTYRSEDVRKDINDYRNEMLKIIKNPNDGIDGSDGEPITEEECNRDFDEMVDILDGYNLCDDFQYPERFVELMQKYQGDYWEGGYGRKIDRRICLWVYGFQEGLERIRGREIVKKI